MSEIPHGAILDRLARDRDGPPVTVGELWEWNIWTGGYDDGRIGSEYGRIVDRSDVLLRLDGGTYAVPRAVWEHLGRCAAEPVMRLVEACRTLTAVYPPSSDDGHLENLAHQRARAAIATGAKIAPDPGPPAVDDAFMDTHNRFRSRLTAEE